ncbi:histidine phosphatase family protein [Trebonia kvetii]|uniref:Histidine phosphatase family protein n=1 Tax=Trebonia kvetii TaxID=2480626 RepID=A0A6P2BTX3_9ACTN|nr:histidine phosphatase family protein [Trebonia kvetii]TVZ02504.1 histidine phosphatase family protein [Trebonia kvetii]
MGAILLVRHGQASFGSADYDVLSPSGEQQARRLGAALAARGIRPASVISGSMRRQRASAAALVAQAEWPLEVSVDAAWDEFELSGLVPPTSADQQPRDREAYQDALEAGMHRWAGAVGAPLTGESFATFAARTESALRTAAERQPRGATTLVVTSAGVIGWLAASLLGAGAEQWIRLNRVCVNTGVTTLISGRRGISLVAFNDHSHLGPQEITYR